LDDPESITLIIENNLETLFIEDAGAETDEPEYNMSTVLKILILEDSIPDAEFTQRLLKNENMHCEFGLAMNREEYLQALDQFQPHVILADNSLPGFSALEALKIIQERSQYTPFILLTGTVSEEYAAGIIKLGADDYILKDRFARLPSAIDAALKQRRAEKELAFQNSEKEKRTVELTIANKELKEAKEELTEKEFFLRESQRAGNVGSYKINFDAGYWQSSETLDHIFGIDQSYSRNIAGWMDIIHPDDRQKMDEYLQIEVIGKRKSFNQEYRIRRISDQHTRWVCGMGDVKFDDSGTLTEMTGTIQDITDRKKTEEKIIASEKQFRHSLDNMLEGVQIHDFNWQYIYVNNALVKYSKCSREELLGHTLMERYPGLEQTALFQKMQRCMFERVAEHFETEFIFPDGSKTDFELSIQPTPEGIFILSIDITERKEAEEEIRKSNERYEFANKATRDTIWEWDYRTHKGKWGEGFNAMFGYSKDNLNYDETWIEEYIHPDDKGRLLKNIQDRIEYGLQICQNEYRFRCADGAYKYVFDRGYILYDENNKPYRMIGAMTDLTEKKRFENELVNQQIKQQKVITETIIRTQEKERNELGRELHDNINQILATVKMYLGMVKAKENISVDLVSQSYEYVNEAMEEIRKLSHSLVTPSLGDFGLKEALEGLMENANLINDLHVQLLFDEKYNEKGIDDNKELMIYRIVQEQMNNITKYAKANKAVITLKTDDENLVLSVEDDGVGFDVMQKSKGIGLKNISSRVEFYSGNMNVISSPGNGCKLEIIIPHNLKNQ
jgi:two-component system sensor histidine kinase UhpB